VNLDPQRLAATTFFLPRFSNTIGTPAVCPHQTSQPSSAFTQAWEIKGKVKCLDSSSQSPSAANFSISPALSLWRCCLSCFGQSVLRAAWKLLIPSPNLETFPAATKLLPPTLFLSASLCKQPKPSLHITLSTRVLPLFLSILTTDSFPPELTQHTKHHYSSRLIHDNSIIDQQLTGILRHPRAQDNMSRPGTYVPAVRVETEKALGITQRSAAINFAWTGDIRKRYVYLFSVLSHTIHEIVDCIAGRPYPCRSHL
jgi:hypothetical protein